jgi:galactokinase
MLGGGDKGASGALVLADSADALNQAVAKEYELKHPDFTDKWAVHSCKVVDGVKVLDGVLD